MTLTPLQLSRLAALKSISFPPATRQKRFAHSISSATSLTEKQDLYVAHIIYRYRKQVKDKSIVPEVKP